MITVKYKGEVIDPKDIEITWMEYGVLSDNDVGQRTGSLAEFLHTTAALFTINSSYKFYVFGLY